MKALLLLIIAFGIQHTFLSFALTTMSSRIQHPHLSSSVPSRLSQSTASVIKPYNSERFSFALSTNPKELADYSKAAVTFFTSIRIPASLIAGNALSAFFVLRNRTGNPENEPSKTSIMVLFAYQALALLSLLMSFHTIVTTTNAANRLLVGTQNPMATSAYEFLMREMPFEYLSTKWAFYLSIFGFLGSVTCRSLLDFNLLRRHRWRSVLMVMFSMGGLTCNMLHMVNYGIAHTECDNFWHLTLEVITRFWKRIRNEGGVVLVSSLMWNVAALVTFLTMIPRMFHYNDTIESDLKVKPNENLSRSVVKKDS